MNTAVTNHHALINAALAAGRAAAKSAGYPVAGAIWGPSRCCKLARSADGQTELMATPAGAWMVDRRGVGRIASGSVA